MEFVLAFAVYMFLKPPFSSLSLLMNLLRLEQDLRTTSSLLYICPLRLIYYRCLVYRCSFLVRRLQKEEALKVRVTKASEVCENL